MMSHCVEATVYDANDAPHTVSADVDWLYNVEINEADSARAAGVSTSDICAALIAQAEIAFENDRDDTDPPRFED